MSAIAAPARAISGAAFATLLLIALMMGANHVAARIAFNNGVDVATAVVRGIAAAIQAGRVTYDLARLLPAATQVSTSTFAECIVEHV